ncbi:AIR synthase related protein [Helicobacter vulpis]|uniref:AIR synthase related protein n=1 Tax=Helicobacter vulpis TaxID=2316076 RepID=UPI0013CE068B|nr:AIR synthase related protein [Helicobacter vulpis]
MGLEDLKQITAKLEQPCLPGVVLDFRHKDDCGAIKVGGSLLVQSVDVIPPVVDDPYIYGQIATANALSDVFAKGGARNQRAEYPCMGSRACKCGERAGDHARLLR